MENRKKEIEEFYRQILADPKLKERIEDKAKEIANEEDLRQLICEEIMPLMKKFNVDFSAQELLEYEKEMLKELSDEDLANVSGGRGIAIKPLLGLGIMAFSMFAGMGLESFAARNGRKGTGGKPGTSQTGKGSSSENDDNDANNEEESKPTTKKTTSKKKRRFKRRNKAKKVNSTSTETEEHLNETNVDDDDNDNNETTVSVTDDKNTAGSDNSSSDENQTLMSKNSNDNDYDDGEKNDGIDLDDIDTRLLTINLDEDGVSFEHNGTRMTESKFFEFAKKFQEDGGVYSPKNAKAISRALKCITLNKNVMKQLPQERLEEINNTLEENHDDLENLPKAIKNRVDKFLRNYEKHDVRRKAKLISINLGENGLLFECDSKPMTESEFWAFAEKYQKENIHSSGCNQRFGLEQALKFILINEDIVEDLEGETYAIGKCFDLASDLKHNNRLWNKLSNKAKNKVDTFLRRKVTDDIRREIDYNSINRSPKYGALSENMLYFDNDGNAYYSDDNGVYYPFFSNGNVKNITVHGEVYGEDGNKFSVKKICLANRFGYNKDVETVTIAEDAKDINICLLPEDFYGNRDNYARHMRKLKKIIFEGGQENITIESNTFRYMNTLEDIIFNTKSKYNKINIGEGAFASCINLGSLEFPENVDELILEKEAFFECSNMKSVTCPENCETFILGDRAFAAAKNLEEFNAPENCKKATIGHFAFKDLSNRWSLYQSPLDTVELNADELIIDENIGVSYIYEGKLHSIDTKDNDSKADKEVVSNESKSDDLNNNDEKDDTDDSKDAQEIKSDVTNDNDDDDIDQNNDANNEEESKPKKMASKKKRRVNRPTKTIKKRGKKVNSTKRLKKSLIETNIGDDDDDNNEVNVDAIDD